MKFAFELIAIGIVFVAGTSSLASEEGKIGEIKVERVFQTGIKTEQPQDIFVDSDSNLGYVALKYKTMIIDLTTGLQKGSYTEARNYEGAKIKLSPNGNFFLRQGLVGVDGTFGFKNLVQIYARNPDDQGEMVLEPLVSRDSKDHQLDAWFTQSGAKIVFREKRLPKATFYLYDMASKSAKIIFEHEAPLSLPAYSDFDTETNTLIMVDALGVDRRKHFTLRRLDEGNGTLETVYDELRDLVPSGTIWPVVGDGYVYMSVYPHPIFNLKTSKWSKVKTNVLSASWGRNSINAQTNSLLIANVYDGTLTVYDTVTGVAKYKSAPQGYLNEINYKRVAWWGNDRIILWKPGGELLILKLERATTN